MGLQLMKLAGMKNQLFVKRGGKATTPLRADDLPILFAGGFTLGGSQV
jgi:hypothetical protein